MPPTSFTNRRGGVPSGFTPGGNAFGLFRSVVVPPSPPPPGGGDSGGGGGVAPPPAPGGGGVDFGGGGGSSGGGTDATGGMAGRPYYGSPYGSIDHPPGSVYYFPISGPHVRSTTAGVSPLALLALGALALVLIGAGRR